MFVDSGGALKNSELSYLEKHYSAPRLKQLLKETPVGKPRLIDLKHLTSHNTIHHLYHLALYTNQSGTDLAGLNYVFEWGGGYGNMARLLYSFNPNLTYAMVDLPIFSAIQAVYLGAIFGTDKINIISQSDDKILSGKINIIPLNENLMQNFNFNQPDLFISTWALSESTEFAQKLIESLGYFNSKNLLLAYQQGSDKIPDSEMVINHLNGYNPFYHQEIPYLKGSYYIFCKKQ